MFVFAHPDDETFGPGGTIARYAREGVRISVVIATSGQAGRAGGFASTPEELGRVREDEARAAGRYLGVSTIHFFGYMDGKLDEADETEVEEKVVRLLREERPDVVVTFGPEGAGNEHRDHKRISRIATAAVAAAAGVLFGASFVRSIAEKLPMAWRWPLSKSWKSSFVRLATGRPFLSRTTTGTSTRLTLL